MKYGIYEFSFLITDYTNTSLICEKIEIVEKSKVICTDKEGKKTEYYHDELREIIPIKEIKYENEIKIERNKK